MTTRRSISSIICCPRSCWKMCATRAVIPSLRERRPCGLSDAPLQCTWEVKSRNYHSDPMEILATVLSRTKTPISVKRRSSKPSCHQTQKSSQTVLVILRWPSSLGQRAWVVNLRNLKEASTNSTCSRHNMIEASLMLTNNWHRWEAINNKIQSLNKSNVQSLMSQSRLHVKTVLLWSETIPLLAISCTKRTTTRTAKSRKAKTLHPHRANYTLDSQKTSAKCKPLLANFVSLNSIMFLHPPSSSVLLEILSYVLTLCVRVFVLLANQAMTNYPPVDHNAAHNNGFIN